MKRASTLILLTTLTSAGGLFSPVAAARDNLPQACAEAAFELTGESRFEVIDYRQMNLGHARHKITLAVAHSAESVVCETKRGKVTSVDTLQEDDNVSAPVRIAAR